MITSAYRGRGVQERQKKSDKGVGSPAEQGDAAITLNGIGAESGTSPSGPERHRRSQKLSKMHTNGSRQHARKTGIKGSREEPPGPSEKTQAPGTDPKPPMNAKRSGQEQPKGKEALIPAEMSPET